MKFILAIDAGTTGNRVLALSEGGDIAAKAYYEFPQIFPKPGWVEHDPAAIWETTLQALRETAGIVGAENIVALGITNQRETTVLWEKETGRPLANAIVWQCRRTREICDSLKERESLIKSKTGLFLDPYFSATKIQWLLDHGAGFRQAAIDGKILFGTVDSWLLWNLTGGAVHATEASNASRTLCFNINTLEYDEDLLGLFDIPEAMLPGVRESAGFFGMVKKEILGREVPVTAILGDQQAALFAQGGWQEGVVKNTYGTGLFVMTSTGKKIPRSGRLVNTVAWNLPGEGVTYAVEGSIFVGGSAIQWLRDGLKIIADSPESEALAADLPSNEGVYFVPALVGMGAPYWDPEARGAIFGLTRGANRRHLIRAALESLAYQTRDVIEEIRKVMPGMVLKTLRVDGGAVPNNFLMQFQSDILGLEVERPELTETTGMGVAALAGISAGLWSPEEFIARRKINRVFRPLMEDSGKEKYYRGWQEAVKRTLTTKAGAR